MRAKASVGISCLVLLCASVLGCGDLFGLGGYTFEDDTDSGVDNAPDPTVDATADGTARPVSDASSAHDEAGRLDASTDGSSSATCTDRLANGQETDVDCGGNCPEKCASFMKCRLATDCGPTLACIGQICLRPSASDGIRDGDETDVDCGGSRALPCGTGKNCIDSLRDCGSKVCKMGRCAAPTATDLVSNGDETDVDCGGTSAPKCRDTKKCVDGFRDCQSKVCTNQTCRPPGIDGYENGDETDVDCGGGAAPKCVVGNKCAVGSRDCLSFVCAAMICAPAAPSDGVRNGWETDVDCGGGAAPVCADQHTCVLGGRDCASGVCLSGTCRAPTSTDAVKNGSETDVDCGGGTAPACANGSQCLQGNRDCVSLVCGPAGSCLPPTSSDLVKNGNETDVDCGGGGASPGCRTGRVCVDGPRDCKDKVCLVGGCASPTFSDGVNNGDETDVDCGGGRGAPLCADGKLCASGATDCVSRVCVGAVCQVPTASDGTKNGNETDTDCGGGGGTPRCGSGASCSLGPRDCRSSVCAGDLCALPTHTDGALNGTETDVDCGGGGDAPTCMVGKMCRLAGDCSSLVCAGMVCVAPTSSDGVMNGSETDVDCGGGSAGKCGVGKGCIVGARDCTDAVCNAGTCAAPRSDDGVKNGSETDVDCGGGGANPRCSDGLQCVVAARDCVSFVCNAGVCLAPTGADGVKNGTETGVDCGGGGGNARCANGVACELGPRDCLSETCTAGVCVP